MIIIYHRHAKLTDTLCRIQVGLTDRELRRTKPIKSISQYIVKSDNLFTIRLYKYRFWPIPTWCEWIRHAVLIECVDKRVDTLCTILKLLTYLFFLH